MQNQNQSSASLALKLMIKIGIAFLIFTMILLVLLIGENANASESAKITHKQDFPQGQSYIHLLIPSNIPTGYWATCNYYNKKAKLIASTRHVVQQRAPAWKVAAKKEDVYLAFCSLG